MSLMLGTRAAILALCGRARFARVVKTFQGEPPADFVRNCILKMHTPQILNPETGGTFGRDGITI